MRAWHLLMLTLTALLWAALWAWVIPLPDAWPLIALAALFVADLGTYGFHVILDHHIPAERSTLAAEFQAHHADGGGIARRPLADALTPVLPLALPAGLILAAPAALGWLPPGLALFLCLFAGAATLAQLAHRWAHHPAPGRLIQAAILDYLRMDRRIAWAHRFNVGAQIKREIDAWGRIRERRVDYAFPGCSDILGQLIDGRALAIECKSRLGRVRPLQAAFLDTVRANEGLAILARSIDDVRNGLDAHFRAKATIMSE